MSAQRFVGPLIRLSLPHHPYEKYWILYYPFIYCTEVLSVLYSMHPSIGALVAAHFEADWAELDLPLLYMLVGYYFI